MANILSLKWQSHHVITSIMQLNKVDQLVSFISACHWFTVTTVTFCATHVLHTCLMAVICLPRCRTRWHCVDVITGLWQCPVTTRSWPPVKQQKKKKWLKYVRILRKYYSDIVPVYCILGHFWRWKVFTSWAAFVQ